MGKVCKNGFMVVNLLLAKIYNVLSNVMDRQKAADGDGTVSYSFIPVHRKDCPCSDKCQG